MASRSLRFLVLGALILLAAVVARQGLATAWANRNPALALAVAPENAAASSAQATLLLEKLTPSALREAEGLARRAIAREPVNVVAMRTLGALADAQGDSARGRKLVSASERLSRRDYLGQLWLIEDAVRRDQVAEALQHYDIALRVSMRAPDMLFPVLSSAVDEGAVLQPIAGLLAPNPPWAASFLLYVASNGQNLTRVTELVERLSALGYSVSPLATQTLIGRLLVEHDVEGAWRVYRLAHAGRLADSVRDSSFQASLTDPTPFDWDFPNDGGASGTPSVDNGRSGLSFEAPVGTGGVVARQLLLLRPGAAYRLATAVLQLQAEGASAPMWRVRCGEAQPIAMLALPRTDTMRKIVTPIFRIPPTCRSQWLELVLTSTEHPEGIRGFVSDVRIVPATSDRNGG